MGEKERGEQKKFLPLAKYKEGEKISTFEKILNTYPRDFLPYPDATLQLTDIHNGIYLHSLVCCNFCNCLFSQTYNIFKVQTITSDDYKISTQTEYTFQ